MCVWSAKASACHVDHYCLVIYFACNWPLEQDYPSVLVQHLTWSDLAHNQLVDLLIRTNSGADWQGFNIHVFQGEYKNNAYHFL